MNLNESCEMQEMGNSKKIVKTVSLFHLTFKIHREARFSGFHNALNFTSKLFAAHDFVKIIETHDIYDRISSHRAKMDPHSLN